MFKVVNLTISILFFGVLIPYAYRYLVATIESGQLSPACGIPMYYVQAAPFFCFILTGIRLIQRWFINMEIVLKKDVDFPEEGTLADEISDTVKEKGK